MTRPRFDSHSTEFGLWLRNQKDIDSTLGYVTTNLDYIWKNYNTGKWLLIEEKRHRADITYSQKKIFDSLNQILKKDPSYLGLYLIVFENTSPEDGKIWINKKESTKEELFYLLKRVGIK